MDSPKGFAHRTEHEECLKMLRQRIDECAAAGVPNVITFSGFRRGLSDEEATRNMVEGLKQVAAQAEKQKVNVCIEVLNSRVHVEMRGHPDYFSDHLEPTVEICRQIGSDRVKILFDIYHIQIMEGDIIRRIQEYHPYVAHYHTAGNPGRNEIDEHAGDQLSRHHESHRRDRLPGICRPGIRARPRSRWLRSIKP